jgi:Fibronectin type III-like domain
LLARKADVALFPFGFGLSYTAFKFADLKVTPAANMPGATVSFSITNTGSRAGATVGEVYVADRHSSIPRPPKELKGFAKVSLSPGETKAVQVPLNARAFCFYDEKAKALACRGGVLSGAGGQFVGKDRALWRTESRRDSGCSVRYSKGFRAE